MDKPHLLTRQQMAALLVKDESDIENSALPLKDSLEQIFSVLPDKQATEAQQKTLRNYRDKEDILSYQIRWADFNDVGYFREGGIADIAGFSYQIINSVGFDDKIERLVRIAEDGGIKAGLMEYCASENAIIWFVPNLIRNSNGIPESAYRGIFIPEDIMHELLDIFNQSSLLTIAEKHLIFQLSAGMSLRTAADVDDLKIETKRSQLKSACSKLQCGGQNDLLRHILGQLAYLLSLTDVRNNRSAELSQFVTDHLSKDTRIVEQRLSNNHIIRVLERGPSNGEPFLIIHGMLWPLLFIGSSDALKRNNIRIIVPIRSGYIDKNTADDIYGSTDLIEKSLEDIALYQRECLSENMNVIGQSYGGAIALKYTQSYPELVAKLFVVSFTPAIRTNSNRKFLGKLFDGLQSISNQPGIFRYLTWQFKKYYADEKTVKPILQKMYQKSKTDLDVIEGKAGNDPIYPQFVALFQKSITGIADDFKFVTTNLTELAHNVHTEILFIHGSYDPMVESDVVEKYVKVMSNAKLEIITDAGHHIHNTHPQILWDIILNAIDKE